VCESVPVCECVCVCVLGVAFTGAGSEAMACNVSQIRKPATYKRDAPIAQINIQASTTWREKAAPRYDAGPVVKLEGAVPSPVCAARPVARPMGVQPLAWDTTDAGFEVQPVGQTITTGAGAVVCPADIDVQGTILLLVPLLMCVSLSLSLSLALSLSVCVWV
jgi:hypothetical protein